MPPNAGKLRCEGKRGRRKKLIEWVEWADDYQPTCEGCKEIYGARNPPEQPPCSTCRTELYPENEDAAQVYMATRGQVITRGMEGVIVDISIPAIESAMRIFNVKDKVDCLQKVRRTFYAMLKEGNE